MSSTLQRANVGETRGPTYLWLLSKVKCTQPTVRQREKEHRNMCRERGSTWPVWCAKVHSAGRVKIIKGLNDTPLGLIFIRCNSQIVVWERVCLAEANLHSTPAAALKKGASLIITEMLNARSFPLEGNCTRQWVQTPFAASRNSHRRRISS